MSSRNDYGKVFNMNSLDDVKRELSSSDKSIVLYLSATGKMNEGSCRVFEELSTQFRSIKFLKITLERMHSLKTDDQIEIIKKIRDLIDIRGSKSFQYSLTRGDAQPTFGVYANWPARANTTNDWVNAEELKALVQKLAET